MLSKLVSSYQSNSKIVDHIFEEQLKFKNDLKPLPTFKNNESKVVWSRQNRLKDLKFNFSYE